jgi:hypothetical protein
MPEIRRKLHLVLMFGLGACAMNMSLAESTEWRPLFNGEDLTGWKMVGPGEFRVEDGCLVTYGGMGLLFYEPETVGDAELRVVYKETGERDNSGVFIRIAVEPETPWHAVNQGYEVQIDNNADSMHRTGVLYSMTEAKAEVPETEDGWNTMIIRLEGDRTVVTVNGALITDFTEGEPVPPRKSITEPARGPRPQRGYIGLQNHDKNSRVLFREISVRPLADAEAE